LITLTIEQRAFTSDPAAILPYSCSAFVTSVTFHEVESGDLGIGDKTLTTEDVKGLQRTQQMKTVR